MSIPTKTVGVALALMLVAGILLAWGIRYDDVVIRWVGILFLIAALVLRFFKPRKPRGLR